VFRPADVKAVRAKLGTSQTEFALMIGVSVATLRNWEQARRTPEGPALALLRVAATNPEAVAAALHGKRGAAWLTSASQDEGTLNRGEAARKNERRTERIAEFEFLKLFDHIEILFDLVTVQAAYAGGHCWAPCRIRNTCTSSCTS
jgi:transcriptional regulator with XRE-family HTH domain